MLRELDAGLPFASPVNVMPYPAPSVVVGNDTPASAGGLLPKALTIAAVGA